MGHLKSPLLGKSPGCEICLENYRREGLIEKGGELEVHTASVC